MHEARERTLDFGEDRSVAAVLSTFRRGDGDPSSLVERAAGRWWFAWPTPQGAATTCFSQASTSRIVVRAWGPGAEWALEQAPTLLGAEDDVSGFEPHHPLVAESWRRHRAWRVPKSGLVIHALVPAIIEQKVTGKEAFSGQRRLIRAYGTPAPGPPSLTLVVPPDAATWRSIPSWEWLKSSVDHARSSTIMRSLVSPGRLEECATLPLPDAHRRLRSISGIGVWTAAETAQRALGDADAVSFGDYHVAKNIGWALTGSEIDDDALAEVLEPYRGHRYRVQRLLELAGAMRPRKGARMAPRTHLPR